MEHLEELNLRLRSLVIFRGLLRQGALEKIPAVLSMRGKSTEEKLMAYSDFVASLFSATENLTDYIWGQISSDENFYILRCAEGKKADPVLEQSLTNELGILSELAQLTAEEVKNQIGYEGYLPEWMTRSADFQEAYGEIIRSLSARGYGVFSKYRMFSYAKGRPVPVKYPDPVRLSDLRGYEMERQAVVDNTLALLEGKPAANVLLYGDAGTGKSSTVKAIANEYASGGLRLIEIDKNQMREIPAIVERLYNNPLKFILFIDDLSYSGYSEEINALKAILEGTVSARAANVVIYATSNRRHLINEKFSDRGNDELHANETIQEQLSLSERFGLAVNFSRPDRERYLEIVHGLAARYEIKDTEKIDIRAERYAIERGGRSPRTARQFVEYLKRAEN